MSARGAFAAGRGDLVATDQAMMCDGRPAGAASAPIEDAAARSYYEQEQAQPGE